MRRQAADLARLPDLPGRCGPSDRFLAERLNACEWITGRVAALGDAWGPILGQEPFVVAWSLLSSLSRAARVRACRCAPFVPAQAQTRDFSAGAEL